MSRRLNLAFPIVRENLTAHDAFRDYLYYLEDEAVSGVPFELKLAQGLIRGYSAGTKFGRNEDVGTATTPEDVWHGGGTYTGQPASYTPETVEVFSADAADTSAGTGARTVRIFGLKTTSSTEYESEDLTLNGVTAVTSASTWWRINRVYVLTAGSGGVNAGDITCRATTTTTNIFALMAAGYNQTKIAAYTVPAGNMIIIKRLRVSIVRLTGADGSATVTVRARESGGVYRSIRVFEVQTGAISIADSYAGTELPAGTDVKFTVERVSDNSTVAEANFEYILVED